MTQNIRANTLPTEVLGFGIEPAVQAADIANSMAYAFGRDVPGGWKVTNGVRGLVKTARLIELAAPYVAVLASYDHPGEQLGTELDTIRYAVEADLLAQNPGYSRTEAAYSVTGGQVARSIGSLFGQRLFAPPGSPYGLRTPMVRSLAEVYAEQTFGPNVHPSDVIREKMPTDLVIKTAAPEILQALGFPADHPMVQSTDRGFMRGAGKLVAGNKLRAITQIPDFLSCIQALLPNTGAELHENFRLVQYILGHTLAPPQTKKQAKQWWE